MVCLSGGKDSYTLLDILQKLQQRAPVPFELVAVNLDQKQPGFPADVLPAYLEQTGVPFHIETQDTYSVVKKIVPEGKTMCSLCSRLRRGILYTVARRLGCNKIALGHHRDDIVATFFLNMFFGAKLKGMPPKLVSDNGEFMVIRPLAYVKEADTIAWAEHRQFPIIPCNLCGSQEHLQRKQVSQMLKDWEKQHPGRTEMILQSLQNVVPSHLMDRQLHSQRLPLRLFRSSAETRSLITHKNLYPFVLGGIECVITFLRRSCRRTLAQETYVSVSHTDRTRPRSRAAARF